MKRQEDGINFHVAHLRYPLQVSHATFFWYASIRMVLTEVSYGQ
jgi:hypothetical protein